ncbi:MAG TPA: hypothetical protein VFL14_13275 [Xanthomonadales bacterium]|nr:hypothetical protein [Xanthomonadales bacterium]
MLRLASFLIAAAFALPAAGQTVFECRHGDVHVFQDRPCGDDQVVRELQPPPAGEVAPGIPEMVAGWQQRMDARHGRADPRRSRGAAARANARREAESHRCTTAGGAVFYRHGACPAQVARNASARGARGAREAADAVSDEPVPRAEACREIARAGAASRAGHEHDARTDTYDHNLGRDPCR